MAQVETIRNCLNMFCEASGQKISYSKSKVLFSKNVDSNLANAIASRLQIDRTNDLGKHLGVQSIHGRVTCQTFSELLGRFNGRLEGWKTRTLSIAGKVTLAKSVLSAIPSYTMQTSILLAGICLEIEKRTRRFI